MSTREYVDYEGERFRLQTTGRYFQSDRKDAPERLLHRRIYADHHGPIPPGFDVHHRDDDWRNNEPDNLEAILQADHRSLHMSARWEDADARAVMSAGLESAREAAKAWHSSPDGVAWHRANGVASWENRKPFAATCQKCGTAYQAWVAGKSRFCSRKCMTTHKPRPLVAATCENCGAGFMADKYRRTRCCSRSCAAKLRFGAG